MRADDRLIRLVGNGHAASGGGLPLPDAFAAVLQELLDHGPRDTAGLTGVVMDALSYKERRVFATWLSWEDFAEDILAQLQEAEAVARTQGAWRLGPGFEHGRRHVVIPERDIGVTVYQKEERLRRDAMTRARLDVRHIIAQLESDGVTDPHVFGCLAACVQALDVGEQEREMRHAEPERPAQNARPSPVELARQKYGLDGNPVFKVKNVFGDDGRRACTGCEIRKEPGSFSVYIDDKGWFLRSYCTECDHRHSRSRHRRREGK